MRYADTMKAAQRGVAMAKPMTGQELRTFRAAHGLSQGQLAKLLGVHVQTISQYETGHITVRLPGVWRWALVALGESLAGGDTKAPRRAAGAKRHDGVMRDALLRTIITSDPTMELAHLARIWKRVTGEKRSVSHFSRQLRQAGCVKQGGRWFVEKVKAG